MGFIDKVKPSPAQSKSSWLDAEPTALKPAEISQNFTPSQHRQNTSEPVPASGTPEGRVWIYPDQPKNENTAKHKMPYRLEKAILRSYDFQNWFETVWMVLNLNNRWTCNEVIVPQHLVDEIGATRVGVEENTKTNQIIWTLKN